MTEFKINDIITLKLENGTTNIYVNDQRVNQCKHLMLDIPIKEMASLDLIESIDEAQERVSKFSSPKLKKIEITPEEEFWGHCSNLQVWVESNYNTRLLHRSIAFSLLKKLYEAGDPVAKKVFKEEIVKRIESGYLPVIIYLVRQHFLKSFSKEEIREIILKPDGTLKNYFQQIRNEAYVGSDLFWIISNNLTEEQLNSFYFDDNGHFRDEIKRLIQGSGDSSKINKLLETGGEKAKQALHQEIFNKNSNVLKAMKSYKEGFEPFFKSYSDEEIKGLFFDEEDHPREWLKYFLNYPTKVEKVFDHSWRREIGFYLLTILHKRGFECVKKYYKLELEKGDDELLLHLNLRGIFEFYTKEELESICFTSEEKASPWLLDYFEDKSKNDYHFSQVSNQVFELLEKLIKEGSELAKREFKRQIEKEHVYTKTLSRHTYELFSDEEFNDLCIDTNGNLKPWLLHIINDTNYDNRVFRGEFRFHAIKLLADRGSMKAKEAIKEVIRNDYVNVIGHCRWKELEELFNEDERKEVFEFNGIRELYGTKKIGEFQINDYLTLKLEDGKTNIYVGGECAQQCKCLYSNLPKARSMYERPEPEPLTEVENIEALWKYYTWTSYNKVQDENDFWGYCSNIQVWAEHNYDLTFLISEVAIPLLKRLKDAGDPIATKVFKKEMENNLKKHLERKFIQDLSDEELFEFFGEFVRIKKGGISLVEDGDLDLRDKYILDLADVTGFEKLTTLRKLILGMTEEYYQVVLENDYYNMQVYEDQFEDDMLKNLTGLDLLNNLEELSLNYTRISDLSNIAKQKNLKTLEMTQSEVKDIKGFLSCTQLEKLNLRDNNINVIEDLSVLKNLTELDLAHNGIGKIENLNLPNLLELNLGDNNIFEIENLEQLKKLRKLFLFKNSIEEITDLDELHNLQIIKLGINKLTKINGLQNLSNLKELDLFLNQISVINFKELPKTLIKLNLKFNKLKELPDEIGRFDSLRFLNLWRNELELIPNTIGNLMNLEELFLNLNKINILPESIGQLKKLKKLDISNNRVTQLPVSIGEMESLEELIIKENPLKELPKSILKLQNLKFIDLKDTSLVNDESTRDITSTLVKNKVILQLPEQLPPFKSKDIKVRGIEGFDTLNIENWAKINDNAWYTQLRNKNYKNSTRIGYYLIKLGRKTGNIELYCYGMDLLASTIRNSKVIHVLEKAKEIYEFINDISYKYSSDSDLTDIEFRINEIKLFGKQSG